MVFEGPKHGPGTRLRHYLFNELVNFLKHRKEIVSKVQVGSYLPWFYEVGSVKQHSKPDDVPSRVAFNNLHQLKNIFLISHVVFLPT